MRVGIVAYPLNSGGGVHAWLQATQALFADLGHEVHLLVGSSTGFDVLGSQWDFASTTEFSGSIGRLPRPRDTRTLRSWSDDHRLDVVVAALPHAGVLALLTRRLWSIPPPIVTIHGQLADGLRGRFYRSAFRLLAGQGTLVAVSDHTRLRFLADTGHDSIVVRNWPEGPIARGANPDPEAPVYFVGRLVPEKGTASLANIVSSLPGQRFRILGDGTDRAELERRLAGHQLTTFDGWVDNPFSAIAHRSVVLHPAPSEGLTYALLEAHQAGNLPLLRCTALAEELRLPTVCRYTDDDEAVEKIATLKRLPEEEFHALHAQIGENLELLASRDAAAHQWQRLLDELIGS